MKSMNFLKIIKPDDWHVHLRSGDMLKAVINCSTRINGRCIVMPNLEIPITNLQQGIAYKEEIYRSTNNKTFIPLLPCYLTENLDLKDFKFALQKNIFVGAKLYPTNATTNSLNGISKIENIFKALEILEKLSKPLLIHGEKVGNNIDMFDREKYFIDDELHQIRSKFPNLKIIFEHVSSAYGADYIDENKNIAATITPQHMMLTKKDVFFKNSLNPHYFCMPVVKNENDLITLRKYATSGNSKFFLGTDSAPHHITDKTPNYSSKAGIFSSPASIELYATIFEEEDKLNNLEKFSSINGPNFYNLSINTDNIVLERKPWIIPEYTSFANVKISNFMGGKKINWKVL